MKFKFKIGAMILGLCSMANAASMTGGVVLAGAYTTNNPDLTLATQVSIAPTSVSGSTGSFASEGVGFGDPSAFIGALIFDPVTVPAGSLFTFGPDLANATRFQFFLTSFYEVPGTTSIKLNLFGTGYFKDITGEYSNTIGTWNSSFDRNGSGADAVFGFSSSTAVQVPDGGATLALLGISFLGLGGVSRFVRRK